MRVDLLDYALPEHLIAAHPPETRDGGRLLDVTPNGPVDRQMIDWPELIPEGALIVVNDTRVVPARLLGKKVGTGGKIEIFLVRKVTETTLGEGPSVRRAEQWRALGKSSKPLRFPLDVVIGDKGELNARILGRADDGLLDVMLYSPTEMPIDRALALVGHVPLPPYMHRADEAADRERYQTVFARVPGAVAAPTAGLHLSEALLGRLRIRGATLATLTLHVGLGTFQPVTVPDLDEHPMHEETFEVPPALVDAIDAARARNAPVIAVGTTVVRALESAADPLRLGHVRAIQDGTRLLIQPGFRFHVVDGLLTNFHLPKSTLLSLVYAFGGRSPVRAAYDHAIASEYRFFSYGDAMFIGTRVAPEDALA